MRQAERDAYVNAVRAEHEHHAARDPHIAARHQHLARIWHALEAKAAREAKMFTDVQETRRQWEAVTQSTRRIAIAADLELRRRHRDLPIPPLKPNAAEQDGIVASTPSEPAWVQLTLDGGAHPVDAGPAGHQRREHVPDKQSAEAHSQLMIGLTLETAHHKIPEHLLRIRDGAKAVQAKLDELASLREPAADADDLSPGPTRPIAQQRDRDALLQPPQPEVVPSTRITERYQAAAADAVHPEPERG
jgi:hypothetical protein